MIKQPAISPVLLVTGACGNLAQRLITKLLAKNYQVVGIGFRELTPINDINFSYYRTNYAQRRTEELFRKYHFTHLIHLGRIGQTQAPYEERYLQNVRGTLRLLDLCDKYGLKNVVLMSTFHVYGANALHHPYLTEEEPKLGSLNFPEIRDAVEVDMAVNAWMYQKMDVRCIILRPCNVIGTNIQNTFARFLKLPLIPIVLGYDPIMQFIHADDYTEILIEAAFGEMRGVFNIASDEHIPFSEAIKILKKKSLPIPHFLSIPMLRATHSLGMKIPAPVLDFLRYSCIISNDRMKKYFKYQIKMSLKQALTDAYPPH